MCRTSSWNRWPSESAFPTSRRAAFVRVSPYSSRSNFSMTKNRYIEFASQVDAEKALQLSNVTPISGEAEKVVITRPPTPQTSTTGQLFAFCGQPRNVEKKGQPSSPGSALYLFPRGK